ncbi:MAG: hypothetical protein M3Z23_14630, partial [Acidobacteriota bacterium]|nr:hypothetical protein [Acidobacteriota bacterium]
SLTRRLTVPALPELSCVRSDSTVFTIHAVQRDNMRQALTSLEDALAILGPLKPAPKQDSEI